MQSASEKSSSTIKRPRLVAVTGATGLIGRRLIPTLHNAGIATRVLLRTQQTVDGADSVHGELNDEAALNRLVQDCDAIVHLAGVAHTRLLTAADKERAYATNVGGTRRLVQAALGACVPHFLFMSSAHVYRGQTGVELSEGSPTEGDTAYGHLKLEAEEIVTEASSDAMRTTILRPCLTYGPGVRFNVQSLMRAVRKGYYMHMRGADAVRSMASVDTVAAAVLHLLKSPLSDGVFNVADRLPVHLELWVNHLADLMQARRPRQVPRMAFAFAAALGTLLQRVGLPAPITRDSVQKLTSSFSISTARLASTGFVWPETRDTVLREMISTEFGR